jgi:alpha-methylacyl-CoA racemase
VYEAGDGGWLAVGAIEPKFFANLCGALGCERWVAHQLDDARQDEIRADLAAAFARRGRDEWVDLLAGADTCVAPVLSVAEAAGCARSGEQCRVVRALPAGGEGFEPLGGLLAGAGPESGPVVVPDASTPGAAPALLAWAGVDEALASSWIESGAVA